MKAMWLPAGGKGRYPGAIRHTRHAIALRTAAQHLTISKYHFTAEYREDAEDKNEFMSSASCAVNSEINSKCLFCRSLRGRCRASRHTARSRLRELRSSRRHGLNAPVTCA
jgi:hypothetical protein